jgi:hypothetical protein
LPSLLALSHSDFDPASRFRILQWLPYLESAGWTVAHRPNRPPRYRRRPVGDIAERLSFLGARTRRRLNCRRDIRLAAAADLVWLNRDMLEGDPQWERRLLQVNPRLVFDVDDAIYLTDHRGHFAEVCARAALVVAGNETLAEAARRHTPRVAIVPTVIDTKVYEQAEVRGGGSPLRLGWCGSDLSIRQTLLPVLPMLAHLQRSLGFSLTIMSRPRPDLSEADLAWEFIEWNPERERQLGNWFDVGIMPLGEDPYLSAKCGCKLLQYMACGLPAIASPVGINRRYIAESGGALAADNEEGWRQAILALGDPGERSQRGERGRRWCATNASIERWFPVLDDLLRGVAGTAR